MDFVDNSIDRGSGTIRARAEFANPDGTLTPGMFGRIRVPVAKPADALLVPEVAIGTEQVRKFVLVVDGDSVARPKYVTLGPTTDGCVSSRRGWSRRPGHRNGPMQARAGVKVASRVAADAGAEAFASDTQRTAN
jgi:multidrug efflux pump subunit AcrA (membrane-fusion protein)